MSAIDLAAVVAAVLSLVAVGALTVAVMSLARSLRELRTLMAGIQDEALPALADATAAVVDVREQVERVDEILDAAESISSRIDGASRVAYLALSKPVIKTAAVATGTRRAARRLRSAEE
ncbi:MAG: hypothetical protein JO291_03615 [Acidimicrobiia bacterium]|nr:hypothetical protein [Acidimicrobiia bacterium]